MVNQKNSVRLGGRTSIFHSYGRELQEKGNWSLRCFGVYGWIWNNRGARTPKQRGTNQIEPCTYCNVVWLEKDQIASDSESFGGQPLAGLRNPSNRDSCLLVLPDRAKLDWIMITCWWCGASQLLGFDVELQGHVRFGSQGQDILSSSSSFVSGFMSLTRLSRRFNSFYLTYSATSCVWPFHPNAQRRRGYPSFALLSVVRRGPDSWWSVGPQSMLAVRWDLASTLPPQFLGVLPMLERLVFSDSRPRQRFTM
ncbi:hypothetical protein C8F04DRAFT_1195935 [Mycena alexandri]|uniref:Uncharacterized protein n=1 Tax=Mycena alexandri TaxID=1745969 RepID=A0AAD6S6D8_9AGAR|nr:hypothetical protein C8F04DRAFT_1195935 [Mycena alexandri]